VGGRMEHDLEILAFSAPWAVLCVLLGPVLYVKPFSPNCSISRVSVVHTSVSCVSVVLLASRVTPSSTLGT